MIEKCNNYNNQFANSSAKEVIEYFTKKYSGEICFASSLGAEDQVITHIIAKNNIPIKIFTLDTGRLFPETYSLIDRTKEKYGINIEIYFPDRERVEEMVNKKGMNLFYESIENRKLCCTVRKIDSSKRALMGMSAWITGLRKEQTEIRSDINMIEWDSNFNLIKINPLINWGDVQLWDYIKDNNIPYNPLHDKGFPSIGCQPCTRAISKDADIRSGRWWWENPDNKECGLHK